MDTLFMTFLPLRVRHPLQDIPGWQSRHRQMASRVVRRMALALPVLRMDRFCWVMPMPLASSFDFIFRLTSIRSRFMTIAIGGAPFSLYGQRLFFSLFTTLIHHPGQHQDNSGNHEKGNIIGSHPEGQHSLARRIVHGL